MNWSEEGQGSESLLPETKDHPFLLFLHMDPIYSPRNFLSRGQKELHERQLQENFHALTIGNSLLTVPTTNQYSTTEFQLQTKDAVPNKLTGNKTY